MPYEFLTELSFSIAMIVNGGNEESTKTSLFDLEGNIKCTKNIGKFPRKLKTAAYSFFAGHPVICGGHHDDIKDANGYNIVENRCWKFGNGKWTEFATMKKRRFGAQAFVVEDKLNVYGGVYRNTTTPTVNYDSYEIIDKNGNTLPS